LAVGYGRSATPERDVVPLLTATDVTLLLAVMALATVVTSAGVRLRLDVNRQALVSDPQLPAVPSAHPSPV